MSLEAVEARKSSQVPSFFFSSFFSFLFPDRAARTGESGMSLLMEERRRKPLRSLAASGFGFSLGGWPIYQGWDPPPSEKFGDCKSSPVHSPLDHDPA
jgi:hypothetical protein